MPPYDLINYEYFVMMIGIGLILTVAVMLARGSRIFNFGSTPRTDREIDEDVHDFGDNVREGTRPVPIFIWFVWIGYFIWALGYVIFSSYFGVK